MTYEEYKKQKVNSSQQNNLTKSTSTTNRYEQYKKQREVQKMAMPTFKTFEEAQQYAKQNNLNVGSVKPTIPALASTNTPWNEIKTQIADVRKDHEGLSEKELKDTPDSYNKGTWGANYTLGDMQIDYNKAMSKYFESQNEKDLAEAEEIRNRINRYQKYAPNVNQGNIITKDFAGYVPQLLGQTGAGIAGAVAGAGVGAGTGGAIGSAIPGIGTAVGAGTGATLGAKAGYVGGVTKFSYDQMRGSAYAGLLDLGVPNDIALKVANDTALWQGIVEGAGAGVDLATLGIGKLFGKGAKTAGQLTAKKMVTDALKAYGINIASEAGEEAIQETIAIQGEKKATEQAGIQRESTALDDAKRIAEAGWGGAKIATVSGGGNLIGNLSTNTINNLKNNNAQKNATSQLPNTQQTTQTNEVIPPQQQNQNMANVVQNKVNTQNIVQNDVANPGETEYNEAGGVENGRRFGNQKNILEVKKWLAETADRQRTNAEELQKKIQGKIVTTPKSDIVTQYEKNYNIKINNFDDNEIPSFASKDGIFISSRDAKAYGEEAVIRHEVVENAILNGTDETLESFSKIITDIRNNKKAIDTLYEGYKNMLTNADKKKIASKLEVFAKEVLCDINTAELNNKDSKFLKDLYRKALGEDFYNNAVNIINNNLNKIESKSSEQQGFFLMPSTDQLKARDMRQGEEISNNLNMKKPKLEQIAELTEQQAQLPTGSYKQNADKNTQYRRKFWDNVESSKIVSQEVKDQVNMTNYERKHNEETLEKMKDRLDADPVKLTQEWWAKDIKKATDQDIALGAILLERYQAEGRLEEAVDVVEKLADIGTEAGRTVQMYSIFQRLTPEGMMIYQQRKLNSALETLTQKQTGKWVEQNKDKFKLTEDDATFITAKVQEAQNAPTERQKQIALAEIEKRINDKLPPEAGQSIKAFRRIAMLFNPKTQVRNVVGNTTVMPLNYVTDLVSTAIDKAIARKTGVRTTTLPSLKTIASGAKKGWNETWDDYRKGIRTTPTGTKYEIQNNVKNFNENTNSKVINAVNRKLNNLDKLLSSVMEAGDRPFYEAAYQNSLQGQMKANGVTTPTQDMIDIASNVALSQTWQDNNNYTKAVLGIRNAMNALNIKGFGFGDLVIPFAKTPANLTKAMVEYSPAGLIPALINYNDMSKAISRGDMTAMQQKKFVTSVGKTIAGTLLYVIAGALVQSGAVTGSADEDKDVANFEKNVLGIQPYSIKIGDKTFTYNWANPIATPFAVMADTYKMNKENAKLNEILLNTLKVGINQLAENSFLQGVQELLTSTYGEESIMDNFVGAIMDLPTQFTPTLLGQIATYTDPTKRQTFENGDTLGTTINEVKNKIPGAKNTLAPQVNTFGEEIQNYGGDNSAFNVFLNPGNISSANATDTQKELYALYEVTKDNTIFPRQAPYSVSGGGEKIALSSKDRAEYQKTSGQYVTEQLGALFDSKFYKSLEDSKKVDVVAKIVSDADTTAKDKWIDTETTEKLAELKTELQESGIPLLDYYNAWIATQGIESDKNFRGETITNSKSKKQKSAIDEATPNLDKWERRKLYEIFNVGKSVW